MNRATLLLASVAFASSSLVAHCRAAGTIEVDPDSYAAVAYSPSTGEVRYACGYFSRASAEQAALDRCDAPDARIVCWVNHGFCALALGDDKEYWGTGWSYGSGASTIEAKEFALEECRKRTTNARIVLYLVSDGQYVYELRPASLK
jgi:hypothetical protein